MLSSNLMMANHANDVMQLRVMLKRQQIQIEARMEARGHNSLSAASRDSSDMIKE